MIFKWTRYTFLGWFIGIILIVALSSLLEACGIHELQFYLGVGMGGGVGFTQWLTLRKRISVSKKWIWFSALALGAPFFIFDLLPDGTVSHPIQYSIASGSLALGYLQYLVLRKYSPEAGLWIPACFIGWSAAILTVFSIDYTRQLALNNLLTAALNLMLILTGGIVLGLISGIFLKKILAQQAAFSI